MKCFIQFGIINQHANKILAERIFLTLRLYLKKLKEQGINDLPKALKMFCSAYNATFQRGIGCSPDFAHDPSNLATVLNFIMQKRAKLQSKYAVQFEKENSPFSIGSIVRIRYPKPPFMKSEEYLFSTDLYQIEKIINSTPIKGYKVKNISTGLLVAATFLPYQLLLVQL